MALHLPQKPTSQDLRKLALRVKNRHNVVNLRLTLSQAHLNLLHIWYIIAYQEKFFFKSKFLMFWMGLHRRDSALNNRMFLQPVYIIQN
jgi:hypothetical protein